MAGHHHGAESAGDRRVALAVAVNLGLTALQVAGGVLAGSLALVADALHNLSDALALAVAFAARRIARRPSDARMTFGYGRAEAVAALVNYTALGVIALYLCFEAATGLLDPQPVAGWIVVAVAAVALVVDAATAALTFALARESVNIRAAFLHNLADAMGSLAVIVAGSLILLYDWRLLDPLATLAIAGYILWQTAREAGGVVRILMLGTPPGLEPREVIAAVEAVDGVRSLHHVHLWQMEEHAPALEAHVVLAPGRWGEADAVKRRVKALLARRFGIGHTTLELECARHACPAPRVLGHA